MAESGDVFGSLKEFLSGDLRGLPQREDSQAGERRVEFDELLFKLFWVHR